jgi:diguanylate cyclase (GGDEF)-like protein
MSARATVLIVEDSAVIRAVLREQLEEEGYHVEEAEDGLEALAVCKMVRPDAVLLDIEMPGLDGHQVLAQLKGDPDVSDIPVVFLTGRTSTDDIVAGLRAGAHDYLKKPFEAMELIARVSGAVRMKRLQDQLLRRNAELDRVARVDVLTNVYNRRHLQEQLLELGAACRRELVQLAVVLFDIDHFKGVNDVYGHASGDRVLQACARRLVDASRAGTIVGRWGGEEFLVLLPATDIHQAAAAAERVRGAIADTPVAIGEGTVTVTVSGGCAAADDGDTDALLSRADAALYRAKAAGRNCIMTAPSV